MKEGDYSIDDMADKVDINRRRFMLYLKKSGSGGVENDLFDTRVRSLNIEMTDEEKA